MSGSFQFAGELSVFCERRIPDMPRFSMLSIRAYHGWKYEDRRDVPRCTKAYE